MKIEIRENEMQKIKKNLKYFFKKKKKLKKFKIFFQKKKKLKKFKIFFQKKKKNTQKKQKKIAPENNYKNFGLVRNLKIYFPKIFARRIRRA